VAHPGDCLAHLACELRVIVAPEAGGNGVGRRFRERGQVADLGITVRGEGHHRQHADLGAGVVEIDKLRHVWELHDEPLRRSEAEAEQVVGQPVDTALQFPVGNAFVTADDRFTRAIRCCPAVD